MSVRPGELYLECVASPNHGDLGNSHWWKLTDCRECAERYHRWPT